MYAIRSYYAGIAFVPSRHHDATLSEARKRELLERAKAQFIDRDFISAIEVIPETYLRGSSGFAAIDQAARLYNLDAIALVSYDQVAISEDTKASILYWTIVGAYFIKGSQHDVQTLVDTAVFDIETRITSYNVCYTKLLRAPHSPSRETARCTARPRRRLAETACRRTA